MTKRGANRAAVILGKTFKYTFKRKIATKIAASGAMLNNFLGSVMVGKAGFSGTKDDNTWV